MAYVDPDPRIVEHFKAAIIAGAQAKPAPSGSFVPTPAYPLGDTPSGVNDIVRERADELWHKWKDLELWGAFLPERAGMAIDKSHVNWLNWLKAWNAGKSKAPNGVDIAEITGVKLDTLMAENVASEHGYPDKPYHKAADRSQAYGSKTEVPVPSLEEQRDTYAAALAVDEFVKSLDVPDIKDPFAISLPIKVAIVIGAIGIGLIGIRVALIR